MYEAGQGISRDTAKAFEWYQKAAEQGHPQAEFKVASFYDMGVSIPVDKDSAMEWYLKAKKDGVAEAESHILALMIYKDQPVPAVLVGVWAADCTKPDVEFTEHEIIRHDINQTIKVASVSLDRNLMSILYNDKGPNDLRERYQIDGAEITLLGRDLLSGGKVVMSTKNRNHLAWHKCH